MSSSTPHSSPGLPRAPQYEPHHAPRGLAAPRREIEVLPAERAGVGLADRTGGHPERHEPAARRVGEVHVGAAAPAGAEALRIEARRHLGSHLEAAATDRGAHRDREPRRSGARRLSQLDPGLDHPGEKAAPSGMEHADDARGAIGEEDGQAIGDRDEEREFRDGGDEPVRLSNVPRLDRGHDPRAMDLMHAGAARRIKPRRRIEPAAILGDGVRGIRGRGAEVQGVIGWGAHPAQPKTHSGKEFGATAEKPLELDLRCGADSWRRLLPGGMW